MKRNEITRTFAYVSIFVGAFLMTTYFTQETDKSYSRLIIGLCALITGFIKIISDRKQQSNNEK